MSAGPGGCRDAVIIRGEHFWCESDAPHDGWPHGSTAAETVWGTADAASPSPAERAVVARFDAAADAPESLRERVAEALLITVLGTDDRDFLTDCDLPADEIARLIVEYGVDAAIAVMRGDR